MRPPRFHCLDLGRVDRSSYETYASLLSVDERQRCEALLREEDRRRFVICRGRLRQALGTVLDEEPGALLFTRDGNGRPYLKGDRYRKVDFNVSHSGDMALIGISLDGRVGVDIERMRPLEDLGSLAPMVLTPYELEELGAGPHEQCLETFFRYWTMKEAFAKALGVGLTGMPRVSFAGHHDRREFTFFDRKGRSWSMRTSSLPGGYAAAVAWSS